MIHKLPHLDGLEELITAFAREVMCIAERAKPNPKAAERWSDLANGRISIERPYYEARAAWLVDFDTLYLSTLRDSCLGNLSEMARVSGIDRSNLRRRLRLRGVSLPTWRSRPQRSQSTMEAFLIAELARDSGVTAVRMARLLGIQEHRATTMLEKLVLAKAALSSGKGAQRRYFLREQTPPQTKIGTRNPAKARAKAHGPKSRKK